LITAISNLIKNQNSLLFTANPTASHLHVTPIFTHHPLNNHPMSSSWADYNIFRQCTRL